VNPTAGAEGEPVYIGSEVDAWHCSADAEALFNSSKPNLDVLMQQGDLEVEISDHSSSGARTFRWKRDGLQFELRFFAVGKYLYETLAISRGFTPVTPQLDGHYQTFRNNVQFANDRPRRNCIQTLWRFLFGLVTTLSITLIPAIIIGSLVGAVLGSGTGLVVLFLFVAGCFAWVVWSSRQTNSYLKKHWTRVFTQGDHDGTVRRALASIGIELPPAPSP
jgi:hypothetical protein